MSINLEKGTIEFKNYFKQLPVPFKIYADFECNLKNAECYEGTYTKNIMSMFPVFMLITLFVLMINTVTAYKFIISILKEHKYCRKIMNKHFNKNLIMT